MYVMFPERRYINENNSGISVRSSATFLLFLLGILHVYMWSVMQPDRWNWDALREMILKYGTLLVAPVSIASTSQILGNNLLT